MKKYSTKSISLFLCFLGIIACQSELEKAGLDFQKTKNIESLKKVVAEMPNGVDTSYVKQLLGTPIDMGFDYRYLTALTGENDCVIGAVFHIDSEGKIDDKWVGEICE